MAKTVLYVVAQALQQPRIINRIYQKSKEYDNVIVYGFSRDFYNLDRQELFHNCRNVEIKELGVLKNTKYFNRLFLFVKLLFLINRENFFRRKDVYVFGLDLRIVSCFIVNANISYEISDIVWLYFKEPFRSIFKRIDFFLTKRSEEVVFTSKGFYLKHYSFLKKHKVTIIENKFRSYGKVNPLDSIPGDKLRIAYVGAFRYPKIISSLLNIFRRNPDMEINFHGDGFDDVVQEIKVAANEFSNIKFHGSFKNPDDLQSIYSGCNINFVAYDSSLGNERVALPNKFYESGYFNLPIVCSKDTYVGELIAELNMGWTIIPEEAHIEAFFRSLSMSDVIECHNRIKSLDKSLFCH